MDGNDLAPDAGQTGVQAHGNGGTSHRHGGTAEGSRTSACRTPVGTRADEDGQGPRDRHRARESRRQMLGTFSYGHDGTGDGFPQLRGNRDARNASAARGAGTKRATRPNLAAQHSSVSFLGVPRDALSVSSIEIFRNMLGTSL